MAAATASTAPEIHIAPDLAMNASEACTQRTLGLVVGGRGEQLSLAPELRG